MEFSLVRSLLLLAQPAVLVGCALVLGAFLLWTRWQRTGRRLVAVGVIGFVVFGVSPLGHWLIAPLEERFPAPTVQPSADDLAGIIVLGGALETRIGSARNEVALNEAAERMTAPILLARRYPDLPIIFSGGNRWRRPGEVTEADGAEAIFAAALGADPRLHYEDRSRTTVENARLTAQLVARTSDLTTANVGGKPWLLVTSAYHMPRAVGAFRRAGLSVLAYPVDYRTTGGAGNWRLFTSPGEGLRRADIVAREWLGLLGYRVLGYTDELFPGPAR